MAESTENKSRWYPDHPWVGVGVVVILDGRLLKVKSGKERNKGKWSIPGGGVELGETVYEAAVRETLEECSLHVEILKVIDTADNIVQDDSGRIKYHFTIIDLLGRYVSGEVKAQSDAAECRWVVLEEIESLDITAILREMLKRNGII